MPDKRVRLLTGDQARDAIAASRMAWFSYDIDSGYAFGNAQLMRLFELPADSKPLPVETFFNAMHPDDGPLVQRAIERALLEGEDYDAEFRVMLPNGRVRWIAARGRVTERTETGQPLMLTGMNWDVTLDREHEERLEHLAMEMNHRVKNAFAVIGALVSIGSRSETDVRAFARQLSRQIASMGDAHALAIRYSQGDLGEAGRVPIAEILDGALAPWRPAAPVDVDCPPDLCLTEERAAAFAMLTYELATNSAKYGGLAAKGEGVEISVARDKEGRVDFRWIGRSSPATPDKPRGEPGKGFGTVLVKHCLQTLDAEGDQTIEDGVFRFRCTFSLDD